MDDTVHCRNRFLMRHPCKTETLVQNICTANANKIFRRVCFSVYVTRNCYGKILNDFVKPVFILYIGPSRILMYLDLMISAFTTISAVLYANQ